MKKNILKSVFLLAIIGGFSTACAVEPVPSQPEADGAVTSLELSASHADVQTKTSLGSDYKVLWSAGDQISVNGVLSNAVADEDHGSAEVRFRVEGNLEKPYNVLYPGTTEKNVITLPATQNYVANSHDAAAYAAYGKVEEKDGEYTATLNNFCGLVRFALNGSATLSKIEVNALGGEKLHGNFSLATDANGFTGSFTGGTEGTLTYNFGEGLKLSETDTYVYIALPAQTYAAGIEAKVFQADGAFMRLKFWGDGEVLAGSELRAFASKTYAAGRTEHLTSLEDLNAENGGAVTVPVGITVATFNCLKFDSVPSGDNAPPRPESAVGTSRPAGAILPTCQAMREAFGKTIYNTHADIIGFNEVDDNMNNSGDDNSIEDMAIAQNCMGYEYHFYSSDDNGFKYANGFAYKADVLDLEEHGRAWLDLDKSPYYSETYKKGTWPFSTVDSGDPNRTFVWAKFTHKASGKQFYFFVTQLPTHKQTQENKTASTGLINFATSKAGNSPQILVGDMNSSDQTCGQDGSDHIRNIEGYEILKTYWADAYETVNDAGNLDSHYLNYPGTLSGTGGTYQYSIETFTANKHPERRIDHIMTKGACTATTYETIRETYTYEGCVCAPSDHLAVVSYITLD